MYVPAEAEKCLETRNESPIVLGLKFLLRWLVYRTVGCVVADRRESEKKFHSTQEVWQETRPSEKSDPVSLSLMFQIPGSKTPVPGKATSKIQCPGICGGIAKNM
jgi:hypothetical protein